MTKEESLNKIKELEAYIEEQEAKEVTLEDIEFEMPDVQYGFDCGGVIEHDFKAPMLKTGFTSKESAEQFQALGELIRVRDYIEGGRVDSSNDKAYSICAYNSGRVKVNSYFLNGTVYFSTKKNAERDLKILGRDRIRKAYGFFKYS
jgi:hypothetical protein